MNLKVETHDKISFGSLDIGEYFICDNVLHVKTSETQAWRLLNKAYSIKFQRTVKVIACSLDQLLHSL